ncbi:hypothetical protein AAFC00_003836 [Neodothiora populina]|uniref:Uncharacterized protein n=1 Tax=Neodothiora populina TaxID=2781224 RepID=A0ABR3PFJ0_9PEZI
MFASRTDQENLTYDHQRAAAAKPLNQPLGTKTPGNKGPKTPFRKQLGDENDAFNSGFKTGKKNGGDTLFTKGKQNAQLDRNAFVTPAGPRNRAPLGMKTTNAKGGILKTPAPVRESAQKTVSPRLRRAKVKIHHEDVLKVEHAPEEPDIEYMPPRSIPLPDYPDDLHEEDYDMLKGDNLTKGWCEVYMNPVGSDGLTRKEREIKHNREMAAKRTEEIVRKALANDPINGFDLGFSGRDATKLANGTAKKREPVKRAPSTLASRNAVAALSRPASSSSSGSSVPRFAAPTANTTIRSRTPGPAAVPTSRKIASTATAPTAASMRHAAATVVSRSTLGYSKGRAVSASAKQPLSAIHTRPARSLASITTAPGPVEHSPAFIRQRDLLESLIADDPDFEQLVVEKNGDGGIDAETHGGAAANLFEEDDELKDFQLSLSDDDEDEEVDDAKE